MNSLDAKGIWNIAKGKLKQKFGQLAKDDLQFMEGKEDELIGRIQKRTARSKANHAASTGGVCCGCKH